MALIVLRQCARACGTTIIDESAPGKFHPGPNYRQRGVRLNTGTEHAIAFCQPCANRPIGDDGPAILAFNRQVFEEAWALKGIPEATRAQHRAEMAGWSILGWADEVPAPPPPACAVCGTGLGFSAPKFCPHCGVRRDAA